MFGKFGVSLLSCQVFHISIGHHIYNWVYTMYKAYASMNIIS